MHYTHRTHTTENSIFAKLKSEELEFPLIHPSYVMENRNFDNKEMQIRIKDEKRLPYPLCKWASQLKWFIKDRGNKK